jgi:1,2-diacylglycerol 3-alpha-glucosyltransferase
MKMSVMYKRPKIAFVSDDFLPAKTGVGVHIQTVAKGFAARGHEVIVLSGRSNPDLPDFEVWNGIKVYRFFSIVIADFPQALPSRKTILSILKKELPDIIHQHYFSYFLIKVHRAAVELHIPEVLTYHFSPDVLSQPWFVRPFRKIINCIVTHYFKKMKLLISPSSKTLEKINKHRSYGNSIHITNPVAFTHFENIKLIEKNNQFNILFAGRLAVEKNVSLLLRALPIVLTQVPQAKVWIAGTGPLMDSLLSQSQALGIQSNVEFLGFLGHQELSSYYASCDVLVLPSVIETHSLVVIEAMSFGKPAIVTNKIVPAEELVDEGLNGFIVDAFDERVLADRIIRLAQSEVLLTKMGIQAKLKSETYKLDRVVDQLEIAYNSLLQYDTKSAEKI